MREVRSFRAEAQELRSEDELRRSPLRRKLAAMTLWRRYGPRPSRAVLAALAGVVLLVGVLRANARYFYCPLMDAIASHACCESSREDGMGEPAIEAPDCCEEMHVGALPSGATPTSIVVSSAPLTAFVPTVVTSTPSPISIVRLATLDARHRGPPPPSEARARTMVFLI
jgi:hypothetical protein